MSKPSEMKPSERIGEIKTKLEKERNNTQTIYFGGIDAIIQYLDECYEKNQPCKHEILGEMLSNGCRECGDCGMMGYFGIPNKGKQGI